MGKPQDPYWLKMTGRLLGLAIILGAVYAGYHVTRLNYQFPRTDDATVMANVVGIASHVSGALVELKVTDNQEVDAGDLLFVIDPQPYEAAVARAQAALLVARSELEAMSNVIASAVAEVKVREAELELANSDLKRDEPLLKTEALDAATVDAARTAQRTAVAQLAEAREKLLQQQNLLGQFGGLNARISAAEADVRAAQINADYCRVRAPFKARVANLHTSAGQYARAGEPIFALVDTSNWYVVANFRESFLESIRAGQAVDVYLMSYPNRRFAGSVQGVGWAIQDPDITSGGVLAEVKPTLNWVRLAQRIPVRITLPPPDPQQPYRMGMSAVVTLRGETNQPRARAGGPEL